MNLVGILIVIVVSSPFPLLGYWLGRLVFPREDVAPGRPVLALPAASDLTLLVLDGTQRPGVMVARVGRGLEAKTPFDLQARMAAQVSDIPQGVGLGLEEGDDDGSSGGKGEHGTFEEVNEEFLVVAHLAVHVCALATDVGKVENFKEMSLASCVPVPPFQTE